MQAPCTVLKPLSSSVELSCTINRHSCLLHFTPAEYCARGSLYDVLQAARRQPAVAAQLTWQRRLSLAYDAAVGLGYLHNRSPPILHRDGEQLQLHCDALCSRSGGASGSKDRPCSPVCAALLFNAPAVKSPNLLVDSHWRCKVAGECLAKCCSMALWHLRTAVVAFPTHRCRLQPVQDPGRRPAACGIQRWRSPEPHMQVHSCCFAVTRRHCCLGDCTYA